MIYFKGCSVLIPSALVHVKLGHSFFGFDAMATQLWGTFDYRSVKIRLNLILLEKNILNVISVKLDPPFS